MTTAVKDFASLALGLVAPLRSSKLYDFTAKLSMYWTALSILTSFNSVQDVLDFLRKVAAEISETLGWVVGIVIFVLEYAARIFHALADRLFGWLPISIPDEYQGPVIIGFLAVVPTVIALLRFSQLSSAFRGVEETCDEWLSLPYGLRRVANLSALHAHGIDAEVSKVLRNDPAWGADWQKAMVATERQAGRIGGLLGFRVFSARLYLSVLLALALSWEFYNIGALDVPASWLVLGAVWVCVVTAFVLGMLIVSYSHRADESELPLAALRLAIVHSLPFDGGSVRIPPAPEDGPEVTTRYARPVEALVGLEESPTVAKLIDRVLADDAAIEQDVRRALGGVPHSAWADKEVADAIFSRMTLRHQASMILSAWRTYSRTRLTELDAAAAPLLPLHSRMATPTRAVQDRLMEWVNLSQGSAQRTSMFQWNTKRGL